MTEKPTYDELLEGLKALLYPSYGHKLMKDDGRSPTTRGMHLLLRAHDLEPKKDGRDTLKTRDVLMPRKTRAPRAPTI